MPSRATPAGAAVVRSDNEVYRMARTSFVHAVRVTRASVRTAARWMGVAPSTVSSWVAGDTPVNPLRVLRSRRLSKPFLVCLRILDRKNGSTRRV